MSDSSEGISFSVPASPLPRFLLQETAGQQHHYLPPAQGTPLHPAAGSLWQEEAEEGGQVAACPGVLQPKTGGGTRCTTVAYVINEASPGVQTSETAALRSLREACEGAAASLHMLDFGKLDFGETSVLDHFYNAGQLERIRHPLQCGSWLTGRGRPSVWLQEGVNILF